MSSTLTSGVITGTGQRRNNPTANFTIASAEPAPSLAVNELNLGNSSAASGLINSSTLNFGGTNTALSGTVTFGTGSSFQSGVYKGSTSGQFAAPSLGATGTDPANFYAAEPGTGITFNFTTTQKFFGMLWGSTDPGNTVTFKNTTTGETYTISGNSTYNSKADFPTTNGSASYYATFNVPAGFNQVTMTTANPAFEFANITYSQTATPTAGTPTLIAVTPTTGTLCFLSGTRIATPAGEQTIESLAIGGLVTLRNGATAPIRWIGVQSVVTHFADELRTLPIRIKAGALAQSLPARDLLVSPAHALLVDGVLIQAGALVNGVSITRETNMPERFTYYHIELADHALILAEGVASETFIDNVDRLAFDNWAEHEALYANLAPLVEMDLPRAKSTRQVPTATRARLAARAEEFFSATLAA